MMSISPPGRRSRGRDRLAVPGECPAGVEPACPVWKTVAWAARPRTPFNQRKERELNPQASSPFHSQSGWLDLNQRGPPSEAGG